MRAAQDTLRYSAQVLVAEAQRLTVALSRENDRQTAEYALRQLKDALAMLRLCRDAEASETQMSLF